MTWLEEVASHLTWGQRYHTIRHNKVLHTWQPGIVWHTDLIGFGDLGTLEIQTYQLTFLGVDYWHERLSFFCIHTSLLSMVFLRLILDYKWLSGWQVSVYFHLWINVKCLVHWRYNHLSNHDGWPLCAEQKSTNQGKLVDFISRGRMRKRGDWKGLGGNWIIRQSKREEAGEQCREWGCYSHMSSQGSPS